MFGYPWNTSGGGGGSTDPGGLDMQVQFNDLGVFGGNNGLTFNKGPQRLYANNIRTDRIAPLGSTVAIPELATNRIVNEDGSGEISILESLFREEEIETWLFTCHDQARFEGGILVDTISSNIPMGAVTFIEIHVNRLETNDTGSVEILRLVSFSESTTAQRFCNIIESLWERGTFIYRPIIRFYYDLFHDGGLDFFFDSQEDETKLCVYAPDKQEFISWSDSTGQAAYIKHLGGTAEDPTGSFSVVNRFEFNGDYIETDLATWGGFEEPYRCVTIADPGRTVKRNTNRATVSFLWTALFGPNIENQTVDIPAEHGFFNFESSHNGVQDLCIFNSNGSANASSRIRLGGAERDDFYSGWNIHTPPSEQSDMAEYQLYPTHQTEGCKIDEIPFRLYYPQTNITKANDCSMLFNGGPDDIPVNHRGQWSAGMFQILRRNSQRRHAIGVQGDNDSHTQTLISYNAQRDTSGSVSLRNTKDGGSAGIQILGDDYGGPSGAGSIRFKVTNGATPLGSLLWDHTTLVSDTGYLNLWIGNFKQVTGTTSATSTGKQIMMRSNTTGTLYPMTSLSVSISPANVYHSGGCLYQSVSSGRFKEIIDNTQQDPSWILDVQNVLYRGNQEHDQNSFFYGPIAEDVYNLNQAAVNLRASTYLEISKNGWEDDVIETVEDRPILVDGLNTLAFQSALIDLCKVQQNQIDALSARLSALEQN